MILIRHSILLFCIVAIGSQPLSPAAFVTPCDNDHSSQHTLSPASTSRLDKSEHLNHLAHSDVTTRSDKQSVDDLENCCELDCERCSLNNNSSLAILWGQGGNTAIIASLGYPPMVNIALPALHKAIYKPPISAPLLT